MRSRWPLRGIRERTNGLHYEAGFLSTAARVELVAYLGTLHPLWERRLSTVRPLAVRCASPSMKAKPTSGAAFSAAALMAAAGPATRAVGTWARQMADS